MSIQRIYEIGCDECDCAQHYYGNIILVEKQYRSDGGIVTADKKHFCDKDCYKKYRAKIKNISQSWKNKKYNTVKRKLI